MTLALRRPAAAITVALLLGALPISIGTAAAASPGVLTTLVGLGAQPYSGDGGPGPAAGLSSPRDVASDDAGNLYVGDEYSVRRVDAVTGLITTVAGTGSAGGQLGDNGPATEASLSVEKVAVNPRTSDLYIADGNNSQVRKVDARTGIITTVAGTGWRQFDTPAVEGARGVDTTLWALSGLAVNEDGTVWVADGWSEGRILELDTAGRIHTVAGRGHVSDTGVAAAPLRLITSLSAGPNGSVYFTEFYNYRVGRLSTDGTITTVAGNLQEPGQHPNYFVDGQLATQAPINYPWAVAVDRDGRLLISETGARIVRVETDGRLRVVVGRAGKPELYNYRDGPRPPAPDGTPALGNYLSGVTGLTVLPDGTIALAETGSGRVRGVLPGALPPIPTGLTFVAGGGPGTYSDGEGPAATMRYPRGITAAPDGSVYVADTGNHRIRRVHPDGTTSTVAGDGTPAFTGDGPATQVGLNRPRAVAMDPQGRVVIADTDNSRIRRLDPITGQLTTIAGEGHWGFGGDGGAATRASLAGPQGVTVGADGSIYVADTRNGRVRRIDTDGMITTIAQAGLQTPRNLTLSADGATLYIADDGTDTIQALTLATGALRRMASVRNPDAMVLDGADLIVAVPSANVVARISATDPPVVVAGTFNDADRHGTGDPLSVDLATPQGLTRMPDGSIWITDTGHNRVVRLTL